ncbi:MAG: hypothetical protein ACE5HV_12600 [Acidobacteriota bacterium]
MSTTYQAFGLTLHANQPIPGLVPVTPRTGPGVHIDLVGCDRGKAPEAPAELWYESPRDGGANLLRVWKDSRNSGFRFLYGDGAAFLVDAAGGSVRATWPDTLTLEDIATYLLGPILGFVLRRRGVVCLHASAIAIDDDCIAILAPPQRGKSTTAAAFARLGYRILTDDILALVDLGEEFRVQPGHPHLRLWPQSVEALFGSADLLPRITPEHPSWDKRYLDLTGGRFQFQSQPLPLAAIYIGERCEDSATPRLEVLSGREALLTLISNTYSCQLLDKQMRAQEFDLLGRLLTRVALKRFKIRKGIHYLPSLCDLILDDCQASRKHTERAPGWLGP